MSKPESVTNPDAEPNIEPCNEEPSSVEGFQDSSPDHPDSGSQREHISAYGEGFVRPNVRRVERYALAPGFEAVIDELGSVRLVDVSVLGARIQHEKPLQRGAKVRLKFRPNLHSISILVNGTVVWSEPLEADGSHATGIAFEQEALALRSAIDQLCRAGGARRV